MKKLFIVLIFIMTVLCAVRVFVANRVVDYSEKLRQSDAIINKLTNENQFLCEELRKNTSTLVLEQKAVLLGFVKTNKISYSR